MWCPKCTFCRCTRIFFSSFCSGECVIGQVVFLFGFHKGPIILFWVKQTSCVYLHCVIVTYLSFWHLSWVDFWTCPTQTFQKWWLMNLGRMVLPIRGGIYDGHVMNVSNPTESQPHHKWNPQVSPGFCKTEPGCLCVAQIFAGTKYWFASTPTCPSQRFRSSKWFEAV